MKRKDIKKGFEYTLVEQCAPVLASIKPGNIFCYHFGSEQPEKVINHWMQLFSEKGLSIDLLRRCPKTRKHLVLVYRKHSLSQIFSNPLIRHFLRGLGYGECSKMEEYINFLRLRFLHDEQFPHEVGLFLGYPLEDVTGFMEHQGKNYAYCGCWKVYGSKEAAEKRFALYKKCTRIYKELHADGRDIMRMVVAA